MSKYDLAEKNIDVEGLAQNALTDGELFQELIKGVQSTDDTTRQNSFKTLQIIAENQPEFLYPQWDYFRRCFIAPTITISSLPSIF